MRLMLIALLACGATPKQTMHRAELSIGISLAGVLASSAAMAALPEHKYAILPITITAGAIAVASTVIYCIAYGEDN